MTNDATRGNTPDSSVPTPGCAAFHASLRAYLAGRLDEADAERLESHAAACARCEAILDSATRRAVTSFAPQMPTELRATTLAAVAAAVTAAASGVASGATPGVRQLHPSRRAGGWRVGGSVMLLAAAAALALTVVRRDTPLRGPDEGIAAANDAPVLSDVNAVQQGAMRLATEGAKAEFESLDAAARELERALQSTPDDPELRSYLAAVRSRRDELTQRVKMAAL